MMIINSDFKYKFNTNYKLIQKENNNEMNNKLLKIIIKS